MRSRVILLASIVFGVSLAGCATPGPIVRLAPAGGNVTWVAGRAVLAQQQSSVRVAAAFEHQDGQTLALRVELANESETTLEVGPRGISFVMCKQAGVDSCAAAQAVLDPEAALMALEVSASREAAAASNDAALNTSLLLLSAVTDVASVASGKGDHTTGLRTAAMASQADNDAARHDTAMASYASQRQMWSNAALRRNTLQPGRALGGLVFIPIDLTAQYVWLQVRAGAQRFSFRFEQTVTQVVTTPPSAQMGRSSEWQ